MQLLKRAANLVEAALGDDADEEIGKGGAASGSGSGKVDESEEDDESDPGKLDAVKTKLKDLFISSKVRDPSPLECLSCVFLRIHSKC